MDFGKLKEDLLVERKRIDAMLELIDTTPRANGISNQKKQPQTSIVQPKRKLSPAARNKIAASQRARWAKRRKANPNTKAA